MINTWALVQVVEADYDDSMPYIDRITIDGCVATLVELSGERVMVIRGTDDRGDWINYSLRFWIADDGDTCTWSSGFLKYAQITYAFTKAHRPRIIVGHSLGGAAASIVGSSLDIPTVTFGSPRPLLTGKPRFEHNVLNVINPKDPVVKRPRFWWSPPKPYRHVGRVVEVTDGVLRRPSKYHSIRLYKQLTLESEI